MKLLFISSWFFSSDEDTSDEGKEEAAAPFDSAFIQKSKSTVFRCDFPSTSSQVFFESLCMIKRSEQLKEYTTQHVLSMLFIQLLFTH